MKILGHNHFQYSDVNTPRKYLSITASGNLLETLKNYNHLYCLHELLTNNRLNREGPGTFRGEALVLPGRNTPGVDVNTGSVISLLVDASNTAVLIDALKSVDPFNQTLIIVRSTLSINPTGKIK